ARHDGEIRAMCDGMQEGLGRCPAHPAALVDLEIGTTFVVAPIEIVDGRNVGLLRRNTESIQDFPGQPLALDTPSARAAMEFAGAGVMVFDVLEDRQDVLPAPAGVPLRRP